MFVLIYCVFQNRPSPSFFFFFLRELLLFFHLLVSAFLLKHKNPLLLQPVCPICNAQCQHNSNVVTKQCKHFTSTNKVNSIKRILNPVFLPVKLVVSGCSAATVRGRRSCSCCYCYCHLKWNDWHSFELAAFYSNLTSCLKKPICMKIIWKAQSYTHTFIYIYMVIFSVQAWHTAYQRPEGWRVN